MRPLARSHTPFPAFVGACHKTGSYFEPDAKRSVDDTREAFPTDLAWLGVVKFFEACFQRLLDESLYFFAKGGLFQHLEQWSQILWKIIGTPVFLLDEVSC